MTIKEIIQELENFAPLSLQEDYDNSGLLIGSNDWEASGALVSLDCTEAVIEEAIKHKCNLVIAHHPLIFSGIRKLSGDSYVERAIVKALKNDIAIYACHTNIDNIHLGVNYKIAQKLGLKNVEILLPKHGIIKKLVTFVPTNHHQKVLDALFEAGAGQIGNYDNCSFNLDGEGTFRGNAHSTPFVGKPNELTLEKEVRIETIFESHLQTKIIKSLLAAHPYEEVAYDIYSLDNKHNLRGSGMIGLLEIENTENDFLSFVKKTFKVPFIKHTQKRAKSIKKVAVCGGSGRFLLKSAISAQADVFITSDFKYHEYFDADGKILLIDVGHYESEQFTPEIFYEIIKKKFSTFAIHLSEINTNPVNYF